MRFFSLDFILTVINTCPQLFDKYICDFQPCPVDLLYGDKLSPWSWRGATEHVIEPKGNVC